MSQSGVGVQSTNATINTQLTSIAVMLRNTLTVAQNLSVQVNGQGAGLAYLESCGFGSTANTANPGGISDAAWALQVIGYLTTISGVYMGTVQQGGSGGTGAATFNFNNALSILWNAQ